MRNRVTALSAVFILFLAGLFAAVDSQQQRPPNIVFITVDALRDDHMDCYGYPVNTSPNICRIGRDGYIFTRAYSPATYTMLTLDSYKTGVYPFRYGEGEKVPNQVMLGENRVDEEEVMPLQQLLSRAGYSTYYLGRKQEWFPGWDRHEVVYDDGRNLVSRSVNRSMQMLEKSDRPFYLRIHTMGPHTPYYPVDRGGERVERFYNSLENSDSYPVPDNRKYLHSSRRYDADIRMTDIQLGRLIDYLRKNDMYRDTAIVITSDHGQSFGGGYETHGKTLHEDEVRVPLLVKPARPHGSGRIDAPTEAINVFSFILAEAGVSFEPGYSIDAEALIDREPENVTVFTDQQGLWPRNYLIGTIVGNYRYTYAHHPSQHYRDMDNYTFRKAFRNLSWPEEAFYRVENHSLSRVEREEVPGILLEQVKVLHRSYIDHTEFTPGYPNYLKKRLREMGYLG